MNIALYARVSSEKQAKDGTIESQIEALRDDTKARDLNIIYECLDDGYSGTTLDRPGLDQLRDLAQAGSIEGVLILSPDRLSRNQANQIILMEEFKKHNVQVIFTNQNFDNSAAGNMMLQIQGSIAEYERVLILDRMRRGIIRAVKNGQVIGNNPPYGYNYIPKSKTSIGRWEVNPVEAKNVQLIYDWYVNEKMKGTAIAQRLNDEAIPCRTVKWWSSQVYAILKSETYKGTAYMFQRRAVEPKKGPKSKPYRRHKNTGKAKRSRDEWIGIPVTPIIDEKTWNHVQEILKQNAYQARRNNNKHNYLLRNLVVCGLCGCMASGYVSNKSTYYSCGARRNKHALIKPHDEIIQVRHQPFDEKVWSSLTELLNNPENLKAQLEKQIQAKKVKLPPSHSMSEFDKDLKQLATQEKRILDAYREAVISMEELTEQKEQISKRRKVLETKKKAVLSQLESLGQPQITMSMLGNVSDRFQRAMAKAGFATREKLVKLLVNRVTLKTDRAVIEGNIPLTNLDALITSGQTRPLFRAPAVNYPAA